MSLQEEKRNHYVYRHIRGHQVENEKSGTPFYIGQGIKPGVYSGPGREFKRAYAKEGRSSYWHKIVNKYGYEVEILVDNLTQEEAHEKEMEFIALYGRYNTGAGILCNLTDGGDGSSGWKASAETCQKIREAAVGRKSPHSEETKVKIGLGNKGRIVTQATRDKMRKTQEGRSQPEQQKENARKAWVAKHGKQVVCLQTGIVFDCGSDAARAMFSNRKLSLSSDAISKTCLGKRTNAYGINFAYV